MHNKMLSFFRTLIVIVVITVLILTSACIKIVSETPNSPMPTTSILTSTTSTSTITMISAIPSQTNSTNSAIREIIFTSSGNMYVMQGDGSGRKLVPNYDASCSTPDCTRDGSRIVFVQNGDLFTMNVDGSNKTRLTTHGSGCSNPVWSPNGSQIAFWLNLQPDATPWSNGSPYVINTDGSNEHLLMTGVDQNSLRTDLTLAWSPDGSKIAFDLPWLNGSVWYSDLCIANSSGIGNTIVSPHNGGYNEPSWSPDGSIIVFRNSAGYGIYLVSSDGSNFKTFTVSDYFIVAGNFAWSPDGSLITCIGKNFESTQANIYVINPSGTYNKQITKFADSTNLVSGYFYADWSQDGKKIIGLLSHYRSDGDSSIDVYLMDTDGSNQTKLCNVLCDKMFIIK